METAVIMEAITTNLWWFAIGEWVLASIIACSLTSFFWLAVMKIRGPK